LIQFINAFKSRNDNHEKLILKYLNRIEEDRFYLYREQLLSDELWFRLKDIQFTYSVIISRSTEHDYIKFIGIGYTDLYQYLEKIEFLKWLTSTRYKADYMNALENPHNVVKCF